MTLSVNGITIEADGDAPAELAIARELLRQRAVDIGLLQQQVQDDDRVDAAIEAVLEREAVTPVPTEDECRRYYERHPDEFKPGELVHARHILFQVTLRVNVPEMRARGEETLNALLREPERFDAMARDLSNCPSGQHGGNLGQIGRGDMVPEFEKALFRMGPPGLLRELVRTRYGFHIVSIDRRIPGKKLPFEAVRAGIAERLSAEVAEKAIRQYVAILAERAEIQGADPAGVSLSPVQ